VNPLHWDPGLRPPSGRRQARRAAVCGSNPAGDGRRAPFFFCQVVDVIHY